MTLNEYYRYLDRAQARFHNFSEDDQRAMSRMADVQLIQFFIDWGFPRAKGSFFEELREAARMNSVPFLWTGEV